MSDPQGTVAPAGDVGRLRPSDLDTIVHTGGRRVRRRRDGDVAGRRDRRAVACGGAVALRDGRAAAGARRPVAARRRDWASVRRSTSARTDTIEVGHEVHAFVRTAAGFVVLDATDAVYSVTAGGVTRIGQMHDTLPNNTDQQRLVVNSSGTLVGWVDESASPGSLAFRIYDALSGSTRDFPARGRTLTSSDAGVIFSRSTTARRTGARTRASPRSTSTPAMID